MESSTEKGRRGEELASQYLEEQGWEVLARNWREGHAEVDLVVRREEVLAFVEVKSRFTRVCGHPLESLTPRKRREVERVARAWLRRRGRGEAQPARTVRFDAVSVDISRGGDAVVRHLPDAWRIGDP